MDDLIEGALRLMDSVESVTGPINIGNLGEFIIRGLEEKTISLTGSASKLVEKQLPADDPKQRQSDITKERGLQNWEPQLALDEGLERTIERFRTRII